MNDLSKARANWLEVGEESAAQRIDNFLVCAPERGAEEPHLPGAPQRRGPGQQRPDQARLPAQGRGQGPHPADAGFPGKAKGEACRVPDRPRGRRPAGHRQARGRCGPWRQRRQLRGHRIAARFAAADQAARARAPPGPRYFRSCSSFARSAPRWSRCTACCATARWRRSTSPW